MLSLHNHNIFFLIIGSPVGSMTGWRHPGGKAQGGLDTERKRVRYAVWSARAWQLACASNLCSFSRPEQLNNTSLAAPTVQHAVTLIQTLYAKKLLLQYEATYTPTQRNVLSVLHVGVVGELGVTPVALTHIGLMPAGDRTSGAEPSNSQTRSFGSSHHMRTVLGAVCHLICKMKMKVIYTSKQYIKKPTASTC